MALAEELPAGGEDPGQKSPGFFQPPQRMESPVEVEDVVVTQTFPQGPERHVNVVLDLLRPFTERLRGARLAIARREAPGLALVRGPQLV